MDDETFEKYVEEAKKIDFKTEEEAKKQVEVYSGKKHGPLSCHREAHTGKKHEAPCQDH